MFTLLGCGSKLSGTYTLGDASSGIKSSLTFESGGKVIEETMGMKIEMKYELDGKDVKFISPRGNAIYTLIDENTIAGPMGMKFIKHK